MGKRGIAENLGAKIEKVAHSASQPEEEQNIGWEAWNL